MYLIHQENTKKHRYTRTDVKNVCIITQFLQRQPLIDNA